MGEGGSCRLREMYFLRVPLFWPTKMEWLAHALSLLPFSSKITSRNRSRVFSF